MLNEHGGVIDDLIVYYLDDSSYRLVVNAGTRDQDLAWIGEHARPFGVQLSERSDLAMLAIQGPEARAKAAQILPERHRERGARARHLRRPRARRAGSWRAPATPARTASRS